MVFLRQTSLKRYSVELPTDLISVLNSHLKTVYTKKTKWFIDAIEKKIKEDVDEIIN